MLQKDLVITNSIEVNIKKFECRISYSSNLDCWYYCIDSKDERDIRYNSLWNEIEFKTQEDCIKGCQAYIDEIIKRGKEQ